MKTTTLVPNRLLAREAVALGRLVLNVQSPEQDCFDPALIIDPKEILVRQQFNFSEILLRTSGSKLHCFLTTTLAASYSKQGERQMQIDSICNTTYQIKNSSDVFERVCGEDRAKRWLEKAISKRRSVYMVVGMQTLLDAELWEHDAKGKGGEYNVTAPVSAAVSAAVGVPVPLTDILDVGGGRSSHYERRASANFFAPGEQVYAVQYRKVEFSWFFSKKLEKAELEMGNRWQVYWLRSTRASGDEEEEDVVDAQVKEPLSSSDPALGPRCEHYELDGGDEIFFGA